MLLSSLVLYKALSGHAAKHFGRQLLRVAVRNQAQPPAPAGTHNCPFRIRAGPLQHLRSLYMTTSHEQQGQLRAVQHHFVDRGSRAMGKSKRAGRPREGCIAAAGVAICGESPSSSSTGSETVAALHRPPSRASSPPTASTKSAKRKAAEALLAAQYGGLATNGILSRDCSAALSGSMQRATFSSDNTSVPAVSTAEVHINKRPRNSLAAAITRLGGGAASAVKKAAGAASGTGRQQLQQWTEQQNLRDSEQLLAATQQQQQQSQEVAASSWQQQQQQNAGAAVGAVAPQASDGSAAGVHAHAAAVVCVEAAGAAQVQEQQQQHNHHSHPQLQQQQQPSVVVPACGPQCSHALSQGWCHSQVQLPHVDWSRVLELEMSRAPSFKVAKGYERLQLPGGVQVLVVENHVHIAPALDILRRSMQDGVVAIDLEWRPEFGRGFTPVAMVQLASSKVAVLIRTCMMGYRLPPVLKDFLQDPKVQLLGFSWYGQDESKMQSTFGFGSKDFGHFLDLQQVAQGLGYFGYGLARLTRQVLGLHMPKSKSVSTSNWETHMLSRTQIKYAALDVLMAGQVFRALRLWHSSPALCEVCHHNLGVANSQDVFTCSTCSKAFWDIRTYVGHCQRYEHTQEWAECEGCGCARALPWPSSKVAAEEAAAEQQPSSQQSS